MCIIYYCSVGKVGRGNNIFGFAYTVHKGTPKGY